MNKKWRTLDKYLVISSTWIYSYIRLIYKLRFLLLYAKAGRHTPFTSLIRSIIMCALLLCVQNTFSLQRCVCVFIYEFSLSLISPHTSIVFVVVIPTNKFTIQIMLSNLISWGLLLVKRRSREREQKNSMLGILTWLNEEMENLDLSTLSSHNFQSSS